MTLDSAAVASAYPPAIDHAECEQLVTAIKDWSMAHGLAVRPPPAAMSATEGRLAGTLAMPVPVTLFPSAFPKPCFEEAQAAQQAYNQLYAGISQNEAFLAHIVDQVAGGDEFTASLWNVHLRVKKEGYVHGTSSDGPAHLQIKQVEFNTIAASFGGLSAQSSELHRYLAQTEYPLLKAGTGSMTPSSLPANGSSQGIAAGLRAAYEAYDRSMPAAAGVQGRCILFLVQDGERNVFDQRHIEYAVNGPGDSNRITVFRLPFSQILKHTSVAATAQRQLLYRLPSDPEGRVFEVAVAYLRAAYGPSDYPDATAWEARYQVERSAAIKCPTVLTQVAGTKKVQQVLATPGGKKNVNAGAGALTGDELARYLSETDASRVRRTFTNIYPLDGASAAGQQARAWAQDAVASRRFVLKPQREGGGNNYYKEKIPAHLQTVPEEHWPSYILMELITPPPISNLILRNGQIEQGGVICELGVYGTCIWETASSSSTTVLRNESAGYLLRTKSDRSEEGGVAAGYGCMDSCYLV